jgi:hypothetical protein
MNPAAPVTSQRWRLDKRFFTTLSYWVMLKIR